MTDVLPEQEVPTTMGGLEELVRSMRVQAAADKAVLEMLQAKQIKDKDKLELEAFRAKQAMEESHAKALKEEKDREIVLRPNPQRFVLLPIQHDNLWQMYLKHKAVFWQAHEVDLAHDKKDWTGMTDDERFFVKMVLGFFAASDGIVLENLGERFLTEVQLPEARCFYSFQMMMENIHSEMYGLLLDTYLQDDPKEKDRVIHAVENFPSIGAKANWAIKWISSLGPFAVRLIAFALVEGVFFSGSFCAIYWLKKRGLMPGLTSSNEWISRDEGLHCEFAIMLFKMLQWRPDQELVHEMFREAVAIEKSFICDALPCALIGMNSKQMSIYIEYVADRLLVDLGYAKIWNAEMPFDWMEMISLQGKTNFFEKKVSDYGKSGSMAKPEDLLFSTDAEGW